jgi:hypothetical protein
VLNGNEGHVTCPQAERTKNHRKRLKRWWASPQWKEYVRVNTAGKCCEECGAKTGDVINNRKPAVLTVNHKYRSLYNSFEEYLKFESDRTEVTCTTCNWMFEKGMNCCPRCRKYKKWYQPICPTCFKADHPEIQAKIDEQKAAAKALQKKLRAEQKAKIKKWKDEHPLKRGQCLLKKTSHDASQEDKHDTHDPEVDIVPVNFF